ncbi:PcfK-like family protein [Marinifilum flexuosum]|uniref:PcfK-like protein n=1 Tax=Marinifilum flexuosum TaxID=1117708 RepID=A0A419WMS9_9BACT|nr:PcfK-like family protein [Marinifilum flexuosum]RKD96769.1 PcfK-like protein [Marinifilum flexuosum]
MKGSAQFKKIIAAKLEEIASKDALFAENLKKKNKNIDDCITCILNTVKSSGVCGFSDDEIFGMAMHYYDEDEIKIGGKLNCKVVTNHSAELSEEEKKQAKQEAFEREVEAQRTKLHKKKSTSKPEVKPQQSLLF